MKFEEAIFYFKQGLTIKREKWASYDVFYIHEKEITKYALSKEDYLAEDWIIVPKIEESGKTFEQVFEEFKQGKKIRRLGWDYNVSISIKNCSHVGKYFHFEDLIKTDWEVIE